MTSALDIQNKYATSERINGNKTAEISNGVMDKMSILSPDNQIKAKLKLNLHDLKPVRIKNMRSSSSKKKKKSKQ